MGSFPSPLGPIIQTQRLRLREVDLFKVMQQARGRVRTQGFKLSACLFLPTLVLTIDVGEKWDGLQYSSPVFLPVPGSGLRALACSIPRPLGSTVLLLKNLEQCLAQSAQKIPALLVVLVVMSTVTCVL